MTASEELYSKRIPRLQVAWDATSLASLMKCPRYYQYNILEGWRSERSPLIFGGLYHECLEVYDKALASGNSQRTSAITATKYALIEGHKLDQFEDRYRNRFTLTRAIVWYTEHYKHDPATTVMLKDGKPAVELSFRTPLPLVSPDGDDYLLCGHIDKIVEFSGDQLVLERKTTLTTLSEYYYKQFTPNPQISTYTLASRVVMPRQAKGVLMDCAQTALGFTQFGRHFAYRSHGGTEEYLREILLYIKSAERFAEDEFWPKNEAACMLFGGCTFRKICERDESVREKWLEADFERTKPWNPLEIRD